jgi:hypothetical protein
MLKTVRELGAERPLDQDLLEMTRDRFDFFCRERTVANDLIKDFSRNRPYTSALSFANLGLRHTDSSCYAPDANF